jgi:hypothetical protein
MLFQDRTVFGGNVVPVSFSRFCCVSVTDCRKWRYKAKVMLRENGSKARIGLHADTQFFFPRFIKESKLIMGMYCVFSVSIRDCTFYPVIFVHRLWYWYLKCVKSSFGHYSGASCASKHNIFPDEHTSASYTVWPCRYCTCGGSLLVTELIALYRTGTNNLSFCFKKCILRCFRIIWRVRSSFLFVVLPVNK